MISSLPLTRVAMQGKPHARASSNAFGMPSQREGRTNAHESCRRSTISVRFPRNSTLSWIPNSVTIRSSCSLNLPSPTRSSFSFNGLRHSAAACIILPHAWSSTSMPLIKSRPATQMILRSAFARSNGRSSAGRNFSVLTPPGIYTMCSARKSCEVR